MSHMLSTGARRGAPWEKLSLRCTESDCSHRPAGKKPKPGDAPVGPDAEIHVEDKDVDLLAQMQEEADELAANPDGDEEGESYDPQEEGDDADLARERKRDYIVDV